MPRAESPWPITDRLRGRAARDFYEPIGRLAPVREEMPPFAGSEDERRALAQHLASLAATAPSDSIPKRLEKDRQNDSCQ